MAVMELKTMKLVVALAVTASIFSEMPPAFAADPAENVKIEIDRWRKPGSNNIGTADLTITNDNAFAVKDVRVKCSYVVKIGGKTIDTEQNLPVTVKAKASAKFKKLKFGFIDTDKADGMCKVASATAL